MSEGRSQPHGHRVQMGPCCPPGGLIHAVQCVNPWLHESLPLCPDSLFTCVCVCVCFKERNWERGEEMTMMLNNKKQNKEPYGLLRLYHQKTMISVNYARTQSWLSLSFLCSFFSCLFFLFVLTER